MSPRTPFSVHTILRLFVLAMLGLGGAWVCEAEDLKLEAMLVWGCNDEKSKEKHKEVDPAIAKELKGVFQWKYYFEIRKQEGIVPSRGSKQFEMSKKCRVEVTELQGPDVVVELFGEGKPVNKTKKPLQKGEMITIGGGDKEGSAWFVVLRRPAK
jgi:hypothetical protein